MRKLQQALNTLANAGQTLTAHAGSGRSVTLVSERGKTWVFSTSQEAVAFVKGVAAALSCDTHREYGSMQWVPLGYYVDHSQKRLVAL